MVHIIGLSKLPTMVFQVTAIIGYRDKLSEIYDIKEVDCCNFQKFQISGTTLYPFVPLISLDLLNDEDLLSYEIAISHSFIPTAEINNANRVIMRFRQSSHGQGDYDHDSVE